MQKFPWNNLKHKTRDKHVKYLNEKRCVLIFGKYFENTFSKLLTNNLKHKILFKKLQTFSFHLYHIKTIIIQSIKKNIIIHKTLKLYTLLLYDICPKRKMPSTQLRLYLNRMPHSSKPTFIYVFSTLLFLLFFLFLFPWLLITEALFGLKEQKKETKTNGLRQNLYFFLKHTQWKNSYFPHLLSTKKWRKCKIQAFDAKNRRKSKS